MSLTGILLSLSTLLYLLVSHGLLPEGSLLLASSRKQAQATVVDGNGEDTELALENDGRRKHLSKSEGRGPKLFGA